MSKASAFFVIFAGALGAVIACGLFLLGKQVPLVAASLILAPAAWAGAMLLARSEEIQKTSRIHSPLHLLAWRDAARKADVRSKKLLLAVFALALAWTAISSLAAPSLMGSAVLGALLGIATLLDLRLIRWAWAARQKRITHDEDRRAKEESLKISAGSLL